MNRYPLWKYALLLLSLLVGLLYTLPNFYGEAPAVQVSSAKSVVKVDNRTLQKVEETLRSQGLSSDLVQWDGNTIRARFGSTDEQIKAKDAINSALNPDAQDPSYVVALNLISRTPAWLTALGANPMFLGLDLRGGVHFLMQVDMATVIQKKVEALSGDVRSTLRTAGITPQNLQSSARTLTLTLASADEAARARDALGRELPDLVWTPAPGNPVQLSGALRPAVLQATQEGALKQNIATLRNRVNELGVAEPIIQQQGLDRIVIQLPGVQDTAKAKDIIGRTATLEVRMVDDSAAAQAAAQGGSIPLGMERYAERGEGGGAVVVHRQAILTGENLSDAQAGFDSQTQEPVVNLTLDSRGTRIFRDVTRDNVGKRMAILLFEKGKGEVVTAPVIRTEIPGGRVQISGAMTAIEAADTALLLRAGSLAAPMDIIEERTIGPSLGAENIAKGFHSVAWGFAAIAVFMIVYYVLFGVFSALALSFNLLLLVALLSMLQATLTLPGIAAIALALGMAIDSNVLINERIREELRAGLPPQKAIALGYDRAWATILDSNVTTLAAGVALLVFGTGPIRGFAIVHCLGILTSMFSSVVFSRALVNLWYGGKKKLKTVAIGTVWRPDGPVTDLAVEDAEGDGPGFVATPARLGKTAPTRKH
ncbi:protein translocase subunit SecD [Amphibiibacter pelophylacis]|uniref:Protein translocase subunit SecD n=1 Tax=Amphibiibacter pelophylacis TaxID=1799477 RepID=A0ACC6P0G7_9BURK